MHWFPFWEIRQGARDFLAERKTSLSPKGNKWDEHKVRVTQPWQTVIDFPCSQGGPSTLAVPECLHPRRCGSPSPAKASRNSRTMNGATVWVLIGGKNLIPFFFFFGFQFAVWQLATLFLNTLFEFQIKIGFAKIYRTWLMVRYANTGTDGDFHALSCCLYLPYFSTKLLS